MTAFNLPKFIVDYPELKRHMRRDIWVLNALGALVMLLVKPEFTLFYLGGTIIGYAYLWSLFLSTECPERKLAVFLSVTRMFFAAFLVVAMGQFRLWETGVVFCGFLSYKLILILEIVRFSVGKELNSGK